MLLKSSVYKILKKSHFYVLKNYLVAPDSAYLLPYEQLRKMGLIYSSYRFIISVFLFLSSYAASYDTSHVISSLPSLLHQTILLFYGLFSILFLLLFYTHECYPRRQIGFGLILDVVVISLILYLTGLPDIQLVLLYMVVVAASFMMLAPYQASIITLLAIIFVVYQQFFYAITDSLRLVNLGNAVLLSLSFLGVGFLSWYVSHRLAMVEKIAAENAEEINKLHAINQQVISTLAQGVMVISRDSSLKLVNRAALNLLDIPETTVNQFEQDKQAKSVRRQIMLEISQAHPLLLDWLKNAITQPSCLLNYELTDSHAAPTKLRFTSKPLEDGSLLISIEDIRREQNNAQQLKLASLGQLTASIAHEIRNPLAAISQASQLLIEDAQYALSSATANNTSMKTVNTADTHGSAQLYTHNRHDENLDEDDTNLDIEDNPDIELYQMIFNQTKRVNRIIEDVLKLSRQTKPNVMMLNLRSWLEQFVSEHYSSHDVFLNFSCVPTVKFDPNHLEQILINLVNNGLRFSSKSHPHAYVNIDIYCHNGDVIIDILDDGIGVDAADENSLFQPFFTTNSEGTGLGLYLSHAFSEANDARLTFVPKHEKTCFRLIMPDYSANYSHVSPDCS